MLSDQLRQQIQDRWRHSCEMSVTELEAHARCDISTLLQAAAEADQRIAAAEQQRDEKEQQIAMLKTLLHESRAESQRLREALELAKGAISAFLMAWDGESGAEKAINGMCAIGQIHGVPYGGPSLVSELQGLRSLLAGSVPQEI